MTKNTRLMSTLGGTKRLFKMRGVALAVTAALAAGATSVAMAGPGRTPDGFDTYYANTNPIDDGSQTGFLRKFVDPLPMPAVRLPGTPKPAGQYIPVAIADTTTFAGSDFYTIGIVEYEQRMHSQLPKATRLRGYVQIFPENVDGAAAGGDQLFYPDGTPILWPSGKSVYGYDQPHYLGPIIAATQGRPTRVKMVNLLPPNSKHFLPVDETLGGASESTDPNHKYSQSRASIHMHGGDNPWISDGTPHQWFTAVGDPSPFKKGDRLANVPDMPHPGDHAQTLFWPNDQSARLMWYHDHTFGLTRQNAYSGQAAGYLLTDLVEQALVNGGVVKGRTINPVVPADMLVFVIQDKSFVPTDIAVQDSLWATGTWGQPGDLWFPHVYEPNATYDASGMPTNNSAGRWDYAVNAIGDYIKPKFELPHIQAGRPLDEMASTTPEAYMDTPVVNGVAYPTVTVAAKPYRVRLLNGANDRYWNLSLWKAAPNGLASGPTLTEVATVPALIPTVTGIPTPLPAGTDLATINPALLVPGGIPNPSTRGPSIVQFGNEAGLLQAPVTHVPNTAVLDPAGLTVGGGLFLTAAERADTVIDFTNCAGETLILYNDASAPVPAGDTRYDYYTGNPDATAAGGAPSTLPGYGPNTRTIMQIVVSGTPVTGQNCATSAYNVKNLGTQLTKAYAASADAAIVPMTAGAAGINSLPVFDPVQNAYTVTLANLATVPLVIKTIEGMNEPNFGRLIAQLGTEFNPNSANTTATPLAYIDTPTDIIAAGGVQYWWIKNNDADNHPMHFHLFNVQVLARIDQITGAIKAPDANEAGWKETVKNWPAEDLIVALKPKTPLLPFGLPNSVRLLDPTLAPGALTNEAHFGNTLAAPYAFQQLDLNPALLNNGIPLAGSTYGQPLPAGTTAGNSNMDFGWEYVWHCHILGHEENDLMRPLVYRPVLAVPKAPTAVTVVADTTQAPATATINWTDPTPAAAITTKGNAANEIGFRVERATVTNGVIGTYQTLAANQAIPNNPAPGTLDSVNFNALMTLTAGNITPVNTLANATGFTDSTIEPNTDYSYRVTTVNQAGQTASTPVPLVQAALATPDPLTATVAGARVTLTWKDNAFAESKYLVQRKAKTINATTGVITDGAFATVATLVANTATYTDNTSVANMMYDYQVQVVRGTATAMSQPVPAITATSVAAPASLTVSPVKRATPTSPGSLKLDWTATTNALATGYEVQRCDGTPTVCKTGVWNVRPAAVNGRATKVFIDTDPAIIAGKTYSYRVRSVSATTLPTPVGNVSSAIAK